MIKIILEFENKKIESTGKTTILALNNALHKYGLNFWNSDIENIKEKFTLYQYLDNELLETYNYN